MVLMLWIMSSCYGHKSGIVMFFFFFFCICHIIPHAQNNGELFECTLECNCRPLHFWGSCYAGLGELVQSVLHFLPQNS